MSRRWIRSTISWSSNRWEQRWRNGRSIGNTLPNSYSITPPRGECIATAPSRTSRLIGGRQVPLPGESSLAHHGIPLLEELPEFRRHVLEVSRQPLEDVVLTIARAAMSVTFPARLTFNTAASTARFSRELGPS